MCCKIQNTSVIPDEVLNILTSGLHRSDEIRYVENR